MLLTAAAARGQVGATLLAKPWEELDQVVDFNADAFWLESGHEKATDQPFHLNSYEAQGRARILPGNKVSPRIGFDYIQLMNDPTIPGVAGNLVDASLAVGTGIAEVDGWGMGIIFGGGYAGSSPFAEGDGWYARATFVVAKTLDVATETRLGIGLDYNGNRTFMPDVPLPGFGLSRKLHPTLTGTLGFPVSSILWKPYDSFELELNYMFREDLEIRVSQRFLKQFQVFANAKALHHAFHTGGLPADRRLLFNQRRAELGLSWTPANNFSVSTAIGYAWSNEFEVGFDSRNSRTIADISDAPYLRFGLEAKF